MSHSDFTSEQNLIFSSPLSQNAKLIPPTPEGIQEAALMLRNGLLVAIPTETVYGLGANAFNEQAVLDIFKVKGRPLTDPLIVHVRGLDDALELVDIEGQNREIFIQLGRKFWPGALTLVARAKPVLPSCVSAGTGFVGFRCPAHPIAQQLLEVSRLPIAAPSANKFGHVSPTKSSHVIADLGYAPIGVLNGDLIHETDTCRYGIESTVCKIDAETQKIILFRRGAISQKSLEDTLIEIGANNFTVQVVQNLIPNSSIDRKSSENFDQDKKINEDDQEISVDDSINNTYSQESPGQLLTHYAPDLDTYLIQLREGFSELNLSERERTSMTTTVIVDFNGTLLSLKEIAIGYKDLSVNGNIEEAAKHLFDTLRWTETIEGATRVFISRLPVVDNDCSASVDDRMFRAASGRVISL